ncbi:MAG: pentapeptide repeat-containing protein [Reichenbachiella sp.]|uniref:pentapeptide repeat-containing protein n=1 Tax=Reichenbachiella sp. TaxID=2184521 RepID=UPI0029669F3D|nr:pentapeptide repeat-containing protein [Reichenbachiella sp.]MDW3210309.1 pentapeptide repeat-containing protein [Reichenbachiella sp.]
MKEGFEFFLEEYVEKKQIAYDETNEIRIEVSTDKAEEIVVFFITLQEKIIETNEKSPVSVHMYSKKISSNILLFGFEANFAINFYNIEFDAWLDFENAVFKENVRFHECDFYACNFENTTFESLVDFYQSHFHNDTKFSLTDFLDRAIFSETVFHEGVIFIYIRPGSDTFISFERATFKKGLDLSRSNLNNANLQFFGMRMEEDKIEVLLMIPFYTNSKHKNIQSAQNFRETYRLIKHEHEKTSNSVESIRYKILELKAYKYELKLSKNYQFWKKQYWRRGQDRASLFLNRVSNSYGTNWARAFLFTIGFALLFLTIYYLIFRFDSHVEQIPDFGMVVNSLLYLFILTKWDFMSFYSYYCNYEPDWVLSWLFITRLVIGYGVFQFVQAFRRLNRK